MKLLQAIVLVLVGIAASYYLLQAWRDYKQFETSIVDANCANREPTLIETCAEIVRGMAWREWLGLERYERAKQSN
jgi:hypothetical protein